MPQMNKGGKYIFGMSLIREDGSVQFPTQAVTEYRIAEEGKVYLFTGSKSTGGFCVTRRGLLLPSKLGKILEETPALRDYTAKQGNFIPYKGRSYCWTDYFNGKDDGLSEHNARYEAPVNPQQRYCLYHGRKRAITGKGSVFRR